MIDEFDRFCLTQHQNVGDTIDQIDQMRELTKLVNDRSAEGIKSIVFAGSFLITTIFKGRNLKIKRVIEPVGVSTPLNSTRIIEASDFTKEQHIKFFHNIQVNRNLYFSEKVVDDIYSRTNGYAGLEGLLASLCIEYTSNEKALDFSIWNERFMEFIHNPSKCKISAIKHIEKYLPADNTDNNDNTYIKDARHLLERFLQRGSLPSSEFANDDIAIVYLRAIGIIKNQDNNYVFTSNIIFDLLSRGFNLSGHVRNDVIFDPLAANQHSFSETVIQKELYALLCTAVSYPFYKIFRETKTLEKFDKRCNIWVCTNKEYGIECKVNKVSNNEIVSANDRLLDTQKDEKNQKKKFTSKCKNPSQLHGG
ncbi:hypothetical protein RhiirA4_456608 [Rhizophagus irregularis]|uniref:Uncharacterized protein n=1 Tax=Rhizophagus irregularis TaxID=588596 RepID=A0A2I1G800_9GLOM|nr:hypothetical protein RhiirA4_456608 [Rhizophagus irregularis]